jgi:DNA-binding CsgD family transcriptional regulator
MANLPDPDDRKAQARARRVLAQERRTKATEMHKLGMAYDKIAEQLGMSVSSVHKTVRKAMEQARERQNQDADTILTMELENLDRLQLAAMPGALKGNHLLIDRVLKIQERRAKLLGLDAPDKIAPTSPDGQHPYRPAAEMAPEERRARILELQKELGYDRGQEQE